MDEKFIKNKLKEIEAYAKEHEIPIIGKETVKFLSKFVKDNDIKNVLEVGTAVGYSAIIMALSNPKTKVITIERDRERYMQALKNIKDLNLEDKITLIFNDALEVKLEDTYDLIFLDGAKGQNINFFNNFYKNLMKKGYIITDNISFHGKADQDLEEIESKNLRALVRKIKEYTTFLDEHEMFETIYYDVGDKLSVTKYRN